MSDPIDLILSKKKLKTKPNPETPKPQRSPNIGEVSPKTIAPTKTATPPAAPAWQPFPIDVLPDPVKEFVAAGARSIGCDIALIVLPLLTAFAIAIGMTRRIRIYPGWEEPAVIWTAIIAESGERKSPAIDLATKAIKDRQHAAIKRYNEELLEFESAQLIHKRDLKAWESKGTGEPPVEPTKPVCGRFYTADATVEGVAKVIGTQPRGIGLIRDEIGGWLAAMNQYKNKGSGDEAVWVELFGARELMKDRAGDGMLYARRAAVSVCGGIQPGILPKALPAEYRELGLPARFLYARPPRRQRRWTGVGLDESHRQKMKVIFDRLFELDPEVDEDGDLQPIDLPLTPKARRLFAEFVNEHGAEQFETTGSLAAALAKLEGYAPRLALVVHLVRFAAGEDVDVRHVDHESIATGITLAKWFTNEARRVCTLIDENADEGELRKLVEWTAARGGSVAARDVSKGLSRYRDPDDADAALQSLVDAKYGSWEPVPPGPAGGRPTRRFTLHAVRRNPETPEVPEELEGFADEIEHNGPEGVTTWEF